MVPVEPTGARLTDRGIPLLMRNSFVSTHRELVPMTDSFRAPPHPQGRRQPDVGRHHPHHRRLDGGRRHRRRLAFHGELQGRPRRHRPLPGGAQIPHDPRHRSRGTVRESANAAFKPGDAVLLNGFGLSESHYGGYAERARVKGDWLVPLPAAFTPSQAMAIGTAGYTAMLCVLALEDAGITPAKGPVVVTGASGGVGSVAIAVLAKLGYRVIASTGRTEEEPYLKSLGAAEIIARGELSGEPGRWPRNAGPVRSTASARKPSPTSSPPRSMAARLQPVAWPRGLDLPTSVAPFILRGVSLLGIESVYMRKERRIRAWQRLAGDLDTGKLDSMTTTIALSDVRQGRGRYPRGQSARPARRRYPQMTRTPGHELHPSGPVRHGDRVDRGCAHRGR